jgi:hypothetical protein
MSTWQEAVPEFRRVFLTAAVCFCLLWLVLDEDVSSIPVMKELAKKFEGSAEQDPFVNDLHFDAKFHVLNTTEHPSPSALPSPSTGPKTSSGAPRLPHQLFAVITFAVTGWLVW